MTALATTRMREYSPGAIYRRFRYDLLHGLGVLRWWKKSHRHDIAILMLHGTGSAADPAQWQPLREQIPPAELERAIVTMQRHGHTFISLEHALDIVDGKKEPVVHAVVLTFDDGYRSNFVHAAPILRKHSVPASFFVVSRHSREREPLWFDRLDYAIQHAKSEDIDINAGPIKCRINGNQDRARIYAAIRAEAKRTLRDDRQMQVAMNSLADQLEAISGKRLKDIFESDPWSSLMTADEIRRLAADPLFDVGSHTVDHYRLDVIDEQERIRQLEESKRWLESVTGRKCRFLCFPNGNFSPQAVKAAAAAGYKAGLTNEVGLVSISKCGFAMNRISFPLHAGPSEVLVKASGLWGAISRWGRNGDV